MSLHADGTDGIARTEVFTGTTAYALLLVHHRNQQCLFVWNLLVVGIQPASAFPMNSLLQGYHLYGLGRTLACTQPTGLAITHRDTQLTGPHSMSHLYGCSFLYSNRMQGTGGAHLAAAVAFGAAIATLIAHLGLHESVQTVAGPQYVIGATVDAQLACRTMSAKITYGERTRRGDERLALWFLLALYGSQSAIGGLLLGMEESSGCHEDCRCKYRSASLIGSFLYVSCLRCRSLL